MNAARYVLAVISLSLVAGTPVLAQKSGQSAKVTTGIVESVQRVELQSEAGKGAVVGGTLGLLSAGGKSSSKKARNTIIGAAAGGALSSSAQGSRQGMRYTVRATGSGTTIQVISDQTEIRQGDCVAVEEVGGTANLRRMASTVCEQASARAVEQLQDTFQQEATECLNAKQQLVDASTADELDLARRKMEILCAD